MRKLTHEELLARQQGVQSKSQPDRVALTVVLDGIRSLQNVGSIFRTADGVGVEKIWLCGITGFPPDPKISKTALGAEDAIPWEYCRDAVPCLAQLKLAGYQLVALEQTDQSVPFDQFQPKSPVCLVLGNEITGVDEPVLAACDASIEIEMQGVKNSLNVTVAFGIAAYQLQKRLAAQKASLRAEKT